MLIDGNTVQYLIHEAIKLIFMAHEKPILIESYMNEVYIRYKKTLPG